MINFEEVTDEHLGELLSIYNYYILNSTASFSVEPLSMDEMKKIVYSGHERFKSFTILLDKEIVGYVLLARYKQREAYDKTAEVTIYLKHDSVNKGIGSKALEFIETIALQQNFHALLSIICEENKPSIKLFEKNNYFKCAHFKEVGEKFGITLDVVVYEKLL